MPLWHRDLRVIHLDGPEAHHLLNLLLTQQLVELSLPAAREWLWLEAKGAIIASGTAFLPDPTSAFLIVPGDLADVVVERLIRFRFSLKADIQIRDDLGVYSQPATGDVPTDQFPVVEVVDGTTHITYPYGYTDVLAPAALLSSVDLESGWDAWRVSAGVPVWDKEIVAGTRAQELGLLPTHGHLQKGCYPGQESIAKIYNLGEVRRALCLLETPTAVQVGQVITDQKRPAPITSANEHHALAMISLNDGKVPSVIQVDSQPLRVAKIIGAQWDIPGGWRDRAPRS